jgi:hypothetical protein
VDIILPIEQKNTTKIRRKKIHTHNKNSGAPQGSPLSPFLFAAYVTPFLRELYANGHGNNITYADDLVLTAAEPGQKDSVEKLQKHVDCALALAAKHNIKFGTLKTEVMLWKKTMAKEEDELRIKIGTSEFHPQDKIRWLGYHIQSNKNWNHHVRMRKTAAMGIINLFKQKCASLGYRGAPPSAALTNLRATILPVRTYGMGIWWAQQKTLVEDMQKTLNQAMRSTITAPITTPITSMQVELAIPSLKTIGNGLVTALATRLSNLPPKHILNTLIPTTYPGGRGLAPPALATSPDNWWGIKTSIIHRLHPNLDSILKDDEGRSVPLMSNALGPNLTTPFPLLNIP